MKHNQILMLTLGHNASAILYDLETREVIGYEQERLTRIKGDSQFPTDAILEIMKHKLIEHDRCVAFVSHWFPTGILSNNATCKNNKYFTAENEKLLRSLADTVTFCGPTFSHHDAHAYSAIAFRDYFSKAENRQLDMFNVENDVFTIVADGFGNNREVLSIYKGKKLIERKHGFGLSLGLMYQYATSFVGMKENQDEYKFLGYESHVREFVSPDDIKNEIDYIVRYFIDESYEYECTSAILEEEIAFLDSVKAFWYNKFSAILSYYTDAIASYRKDIREFIKCCIIGYYVQAVVERVILHYIDKYDMHDVNVAGGLFYNVKLNNAILTHIDGTFCPMPLAGDQGAAIGMAYHFVPEIANDGFNFGNLCWGNRTFYNVDKAIKGLKMANFCDMLCDCHITDIAQKLANGNIVNIVGPNMEFGPRALCMTTTLFLPTAENTAANNYMNGRNEVMPCAPVCTKENAQIMFSKKELDRVIGSDAFMICTHEYRKCVYPTNMRSGAMHVKPDDPTAFTGRPQIVSNKHSYISQILIRVQELTGIEPLFLVNTSFNVHGQPIVFDLHSIIQNYKYQLEHAVAGHEPYLYIFASTEMI